MIGADILSGRLGMFQKVFKLWAPIDGKVNVTGAYTDPGNTTTFMWLAPKIRGPFLVVLMIRALLFWGLYKGP